MTREETRTILSILKAYYPQSYKNLNNTEMNNILDVWCDMTREMDYQETLSAIKYIMATDTREFAPNVAQINDIIYKMKTPDSDMSEQEAWNLVYKAICNSGYNSQKEFDKLPQELQRLVGSPSQLYEWSQMSTTETTTVVASNFMRSYKARKASNKEYAMLPNSIKQIISTNNVKAIDGFKTTEMLLGDTNDNG